MHLKIDQKEMRIPTKVYDVTEKKLLGVFESRMDAAKFLGVTQDRVCKAYNSKGRIHNSPLGGVYCIR